MENSKEKVSIAKNIHSIEGIKVNILAGVTRIFASLNNGKEEKALDYIVFVMITLFRLARKLGYSYRKLDEKLVEQVNIMNVDECTDLKEDIEELRQYLTVRGE